MLCVLKDLNIDCLTDKFRTYEGENAFSNLKSFFDNVEEETNPIKRMALLDNLKVHSKSDISDVSLFGQRLTDFKNGIEFKKLVQLAYPDIDGYMWREFKDSRGLTYCLFNAEKLVSKETNTIIKSK